MKKVILYISLLTLTYSCAQQGENRNASFEKDSKTIVEENDAAELEEISEETGYKTNIGLEAVISQKLQEVYDLQSIVFDSTLDAEIRNEAKESLKAILLQTDSVEYIKNANVSNVIITSENELVIFKADNKTMEADIKVLKESVIIDGEEIDNIDITIEEIR